MRPRHDSDTSRTFSRSDCTSLRPLQEHLGDPDCRILCSAKDSFASGVPVGTEGLPRTPAVYERKTKWRKTDDSTFNPDRTNYQTAIGLEDILDKQFEEEAALGMCYKTSDKLAREQFPGTDLRIASIGAIEKSDESFRIIHDGTHGVQVNNEARMRDRIRMPGPREEKEIIRRASQESGPFFSIQADVSKAHRRFLYRKCDWGLLACRTHPGSIWINRVGTFGIGSAGYLVG